MRLRRVVLACALGGLVAVAVPGVASAHPLGNFTINQASAVRLEPDAISIDHVVDMAEIPTFQSRQDIDGNHDDRFSAPEKRRWATAECARIARSVDVTVGGKRVPLTSGVGAVSFPSGQAGLPTLRLVCRLRGPAALADGSHAVHIENRFEGERIGWREITAVGDHTTLLRGAPSAVSPSASLTKYPADRLSSPLDERSVGFTVRGGGAAAPRPPPIPTVTGSVVRGFDDLTQSLTSSVAARRLTLGLALVAVAIAIGLGALHSFAPGHGKTVMAAYLVGERGTVKDGLLIGVTVATTHTLGVLLLGAVLTASQTFAPESVYPYLSLASGVCFAGLGVMLLVGALRRRRVSFLGLHHHHHGPGGHTHGPVDLGLVAHHGHDAPDEHVDAPLELVGTGVAHGPNPDHVPAIHHHHHDHAHHDHADDDPVAHDHADDEHADHEHADHEHADHEHADHDHGTHDHEPESAALSRRRLLTLGFAGGLVPTPTAIVVLLGATAIGRAWFGALLVVFYGIGMGGTLVLAGLLLARARRRFDLSKHAGRAWKIAAIFPLLTAIVIISSGLWLVARAAIAF